MDYTELRARRRLLRRYLRRYRLEQTEAAYKAVEGILQRLPDDHPAAQIMRLRYKECRNWRTVEDRTFYCHSRAFELETAAIDALLQSTEVVDAITSWEAAQNDHWKKPAAFLTRPPQQRNWRRSNITTDSAAKRLVLRPSTKPAPFWWNLPAAITRKVKSKWTGFVDFSPAASWAASSPWQLPRPAAKRRWICTRRTGTRRSIRSKQRARRWTRSRKAAKYED